MKLVDRIAVGFVIVCCVLGVTHCLETATQIYYPLDGKSYQYWNDSSNRYAWPEGYGIPCPDRMENINKAAYVNKSRLEFKHPFDTCKITTFAMWQKTSKTEFLPIFVANLFAVSNTGIRGTYGDSVNYVFDNNATATWNHIVITVDVWDTITIYKNGALFKKVSVSVYKGGGQHYPTVVAGKVRNNVNDYIYTGTLDEFRIYSYKLTPVQVKALYDSYSKPVSINTTIKPVFKPVATKLTTTTNLLGKSISRISLNRSIVCQEQLVKVIQR